MAKIVTVAAGAADDPFADRKGLVRTATMSIEALLDEYFDMLLSERTLIDDTIRVIIPSARPTRNRRRVPTIEPSNEGQREVYTNRLCATLNEWAKNGPFVVAGRAIASATLGIGVAILQKRTRGSAAPGPVHSDGDLLAALQRLRRLTSRRLNTFDLIRGTKVFEQDRLYLVKPIGHRFWTETSALNDADEIAGSILMHSSKEMA